MSSFFTVPASQKKRKRAEIPTAPSSKKRSIAKTPARSKKPVSDDDSISGSESSDNDAKNGRSQAEGDGSDFDSEEDENETAAERRLKLAERYLDNIRSEVADGQEAGLDAADLDREIISARLKQDVAEDKGRVYKSIAESLNFDAAEHTKFRTNTTTVTGVAASRDHVYVVTKDRTLSRWLLQKPSRLQPSRTDGKVNPFGRKKPTLLKMTKGSHKKLEEKGYMHHAAPILCVAASADGRFVVTGGTGHRYWSPTANRYTYTGRMIVWDPETLQPLKVFNDHRDAVTCVAFRGATNQLFSGSKDRTIKMYSLDELAYIQTLFGHQDEVTDVAAVGGSQERCVSVGARDRSARLWKVVEESQLVFRGGGSGSSKKKKKLAAGGEDEIEVDPTPEVNEGSLDRVIQVDTQLFVTGADNGDLALFGLHKKKPLHILPFAHGYDLPSESMLEDHRNAGRTIANPAAARPITALASVPYSDLFVSGSWDGCVRVWKIDMETKKIESVAALGKNVHTGASQPTVPLKGVINDLTVFERGENGSDGVSIVAGFGKEMRQGQWHSAEDGFNGCAVFNIARKSIDRQAVSHGQDPATNGHEHD